MGKGGEPFRGRGAGENDRPGQDDFRGEVGEIEGYTRPSDVTVSRSSPWSPLSKIGTQIISTQQASATHGSRCAQRCVRFPRGHGVILEFE